MSLRRSPSGQGNLHIFKNVDLVVYTEGGTGVALSKEDILAGQGADHSDDIQFWSAIFDLYRPDLSIKFLSVGNSTVLKEIAADILNGDIAGVCVVLDRDYCNFWLETLDHHNVIYSRTYSWENELFNAWIILKVLGLIMPRGFDVSAASLEVEGALASINKDLRPFFLSDIVLVSAGSSFFCRKSPGLCFVHEKKRQDLPKIDKARMKQRLNELRGDVRGFRLLYSVSGWDVARDVYGKPLLHAVRSIIQYYLSDSNLPSLPSAYVQKFLIDAFKEFLEAEISPETSDFYRRKLLTVA